MKTSKVILGLKRPFEFSLEERKLIIEEWLQGGKTKREIWRKYTGEEVETEIEQWLNEK